VVPPGGGDCSGLFPPLPGEAQETIAIQQSPQLKVLGRFVGSWTWKVTSKQAEWTMVIKDRTGKVLVDMEGMVKRK
jgi:hypothetical protein